ncbi:MAG: hypothetical protein LBQ54_05615 [Planctomycetaceae bacterium]|jgi:hypothetical protein|nr:hypothetical protein [Planctomycetaceae bacterium]
MEKSMKVCGNCKFAKEIRLEEVRIWCSKEFKRKPAKRDWFLIVDFCKDFEPRDDISSDDEAEKQKEEVTE